MVKTPSQASQDLEDLPHVDALVSTPDHTENTDNASSSSAPTAPQADRARLKRQMKEQADTIRLLQEQLQHATNALHDSQNTQDELNSLIQQTMTPGRRETPGPHRLQPKGLRQEDKDFQDKVRQQTPDDPNFLTLMTPGSCLSKPSQKQYRTIITTTSMNPSSSPVKTNNGTNSTIIYDRT